MAVAAETWEQVESIEHQGIIDANQFFAREDIAHEAWELINNRAEVFQPAVLSQEYKDNSRTAIMEALTASGHLSRVTLSGSLKDIEAQMTGRLVNGWDDNLPGHEKDRRFAELCNVLYGQKVRAAVVAGELPENTAILEISDYPEPLAGTKIGYRDKNKKGMVRSTHLVNQGNGQYDLIIEQGSRSNATGDSTFDFFDACGISPSSDHEAADLAALETPMLYNTYDYVDGTVDIMRRLDQHSGEGVLYGDSGSAKARHVSYECLREESQRREDEIERFSDELAKLEEQLDNLVDRGQIPAQERTDIFNGEIERILAAICTLEPSYAETTFGEKAAPAFHEAAILVARGQNAQAEQLLMGTAHLRDEITFCGATISTKEAQDLGLNVNSYSEHVGKGRANWSWKSGVCVVESCSTRPGRTRVGPCSICKNCQTKFDKGQDPTKSAVPKIE
ncbi:MAG TPA: hypothetical protein VMR28_02535, partial [Candidatus Saccharimonadales bacterium]|nr:hypothetical protein [Candidatus Saccharimonadales bacterium]